MGFHLPENYARWVAALLVITVLLMVPWLLLWDWIAGLNLMPDVFTDMFKTLGLIGVSFVGANLYVQRHLRRLAESEDL